VLGLLAAAFVGLFALDAFAGDASLGMKLIGFAIHLLPAAIVLVVVGIAWRWEMAGGLLLILAGIAYTLSIDAAAHPDWVAVIAGPLWLVGALFLLSHAFGAGRRTESRAV
jgi:hypothetical protein